MQAEEDRLLKFLEDLDPLSLGKVIARQHASQYVTATAPALQQVQELWRFVTSGEESGIPRLTQVIRELFPRYEASATEKAPQFVNLPSRNVHFAGREGQLTALRRTLVQDGTAAVTQTASSSAAISGLGGVGKTALAIEYAYRFAEDYSCILFGRADMVESLQTSFTTFARELDLPEKDVPEIEAIVAAVKHWLTTEQGWLLILDNADFTGNLSAKALASYLPPQLGGQILMTSRSQHFAGGLNIRHPLRLDVLTPDEAEMFMMERTEKNVAILSDAEREVARELASALGYLPLALEQAAAYIAVQNMSFTGYRAEYDRVGLSLLEEAGPETGGYPHTIRTTWQISFEAVARESAAAVEVLNLCTFLAPEDIPAELIVHGAPHIGEATAHHFADGLAVQDIDVLLTRYDQVIAPLWRYSLLSKQVEVYTVSIHRMVQAVLQDRLAAAHQKREVVERAVTVLNHVFPDGEFASWSRCERLLPHALMAARWIHREKTKSEQAGRLLNQAGLYLHYHGNYAEAEPLYKQALEMCQPSLADNHPFIALRLNNLAGLHHSQGRYSDAESLYKQALDIHLSILPRNHPDIAIVMNNLAGLYQAQSRFSDAEPLLKQALEIRQSTLPNNHPDTALSMNNMAELYSSKGNYSDAEDLYKQALKIYLSILPRNNLDIAMILNNLSGLYKFQGRLSDAEPLLKQALEIHQSTLPNNHPDTALSMNNLAMLYKEQGRLSEAEPLYKQALDIMVQALGKDHPNTQIVAENYKLLQDALQSGR